MRRFRSRRIPTTPSSRSRSSRSGSSVARPSCVRSATCGARTTRPSAAGSRSGGPLCLAMAVIAVAIECRGAGGRRHRRDAGRRAARARSPRRLGSRLDRRRRGGLSAVAVRSWRRRASMERTRFIDDLRVPRLAGRTGAHRDLADRVGRAILSPCRHRVLVPGVVGGLATGVAASAWHRVPRGAVGVTGGGRVVRVVVGRRRGRRLPRLPRAAPDRPVGTRSLRSNLQRSTSRTGS